MIDHPLQHKTFSLKTWIPEHKKAVLMFEHNSKLACHVHEHHHHMDFENDEILSSHAHTARAKFQFNNTFIHYVIS